MLKSFASFVLASTLLVGAGSAYAWETRALTLGDQNRFIEDDANIWIYPQTLGKYGQRVYLDLDRRNGRIVDSVGDLMNSEDYGAMKTVNGGMMLEVMEGLNVAIWASNQMDPVPGIFLLGATGVQKDIPNAGANATLSNEEALLNFGLLEPIGRVNINSSRKFDVFASYRLSDELQVGLHTWLGSSSSNHYVGDQVADNDANEVETIFGSTHFGLGGGASLSLGDLGNLDLGLRYTLYTYELAQNSHNQPTVDASHRLSADARLSGRLSKYWWFTPSVQFNYMHFSAFVDPDPERSYADTQGPGDKETDILWDAFNVDIGLGLQMRVPNKGTLYTAVGIDYGESNFRALPYAAAQADKLERLTRLQLPYLRTGFEAPLFDWMDLRVGFVKRWSSLSSYTEFFDSGTDNRPSRDYVDDFRRSEDSESLMKDFESFVGATFRHRGWYVSVELDPHLLFHGPFSSVDSQSVGDGDTTVSDPVSGSSADGSAPVVLDGYAPWFARLEISYRF